MAKGDLGRVYSDGEVLCRQGETGDAMFVIQEGTVDVVVTNDGHETRLARLGAGDIIGEMAILERDVRSATARAVGEVRAVTVDRKNLLGRVAEDPSLALRLIRILAGRIRDLNAEVARLRR